MAAAWESDFHLNINLQILLPAISAIKSEYLLILLPNLWL